MDSICQKLNKTQICQGKKILKITSNNATRVHTKSSQQPGKLTFDEASLRQQFGDGRVRQSLQQWQVFDDGESLTTASLQRQEPSRTFNGGERTFDEREVTRGRRVFDYSKSATNLRKPSTAASENYENCDGEREKKT
ncbi:hypothetical protein LR48_Vigan10g187400 [Vigna angularis]|uniref:Uncharacterized protein n=1 Tax=Phaseolus angularis TaxID=3914 RepID=A0A0L9VM79_PHAAN|nr:hypothetical protein LR48_Vigan10g187400 [Vigna angularis]